MADKITIEVEGIEKTISNLKSWQVIKTEAVKIALKETGFMVEHDAKQDCPVDTGRLRASISTNWSASPRSRGTTGPQAKADDGVGRPSGKPGMTVVVGTNVEYAPYVHFGTIRPLKWGGYRLMAGRPFLAQAYHKNEPRLEIRLREIFKK